MKMNIFGSILYSIVLLITCHIIGAQDCAAVKANIDSYLTIDDLKQYLKSNVPRQNIFNDLFKCLAGPQRLPTAIISDGKSFILGEGWGSLRSYKYTKLSLWNRIQLRIGRYWWIGKVYMQKANGKVSLLNVVPPFKALWFYADVYNSPSVVDDADCIVLDYRNDTSLPGVSQEVASVFRDEMREILWRGNNSKIFLGRAYVFSGKRSELYTSEWLNPRKYTFGANFINDCRPDSQGLFPDWARKFYE